MSNKSFADQIAHSLSDMAILPSALQGGIVNSPTGRGKLYSSAANNGNVESFSNSAKTFKPEVVSMDGKNATISIGGVKTPIKSITVNGGSTVTVSTDAENITVRLPIVTGPAGSVESNQTGQFIKNLISESKNLQVNKIQEGQPDSSGNRKIIADIAVSSDGEVVGTVAEGLSSTAIAPPANTSMPYPASYPAAENEMDYVPSLQGNKIVYYKSVNDEIATSNAKLKTERALNNGHEKSERPDLITDIRVGVNFNDRAIGYGDEILEKDSRLYSFKIGDVILRIPPTHLTITQLRSSNESSMIGFHSFTSSSPTSRVSFKINAVFSGKQIDDDLKRLIVQFTYCPFNIIHSKDLADILISEDSTLKASIGSNSIMPHVPVTMDDYTVYTLDGHPNALGCTMQFSLFNFMPYFDGDVSESFKYLKIAFNEKTGTVPDTAETTTHLEKAIHPYNFDIMKILQQKDRQWGSNIDIDGFSEADIDEANESIVHMHKLTSFLDMDFELLDTKVKESDISFICDSISVRYENKFAWFPIGGYSQAIAQYIGPGSSVISMSAKVALSDHVKLSRLLKTYHETRSKDMNAFYDDRYQVYSSMTKLTDCLYASITDIAITSLPQHPGFSDINIMMRKSPYVHETLHSNRVAEPDYYWGMQRIIKAVEASPSLMTEVENELQNEKSDVYDEYGWMAKWAENNKSLSSVLKVDMVIVQTINIAVDKIYNNSQTSISEKKVLDSMILSNSSRIDITELLDDIELFFDAGRTKGKSFRKAETVEVLATDLIMAKVSGDYNVLFNQITAPVGDDELRDIIYKTVTKFPGIFSNKASEYVKALNILMKNISKANSQSGKDLIWQSAEMVEYLRKALDSIQPSYNFTRRRTSEIREILSRNTWTSYGCPLVPTEGVTQDVIYNVFLKIKNACNDMRVEEVSVATMESPLFASQVVWLGTVQNDKATQVIARLEKAKKDQVAKKVDLNDIHIHPPFAAHRYYPQCDSMVKSDPRFSSTIGSYFFTNIADTDGHLRSLINKFQTAIGKTISPSTDYVAWKPIIPEGTDGGIRLSEAEQDNDPLLTQSAIAMPELRKDIDRDTILYNAKTGSSDRPTPWMVIASHSIGAFTETSDSIDRPFSGLSGFIFMSKLSGSKRFGSPGYDAIRNHISKRIEVDYTLTGNAGNPVEGPESSMYRLMNLGLGVIDSNGNLLKKSETTPLAQSGVGSNDNGFTSKQDQRHKTTSLLNYMANYASANLNAELVTPTKTKNNITPTEPLSINKQPSTIKVDVDNVLANIITVLQTVQNGIISIDNVPSVADKIWKYIGATVGFDTAQHNIYSLTIEDINYAITEAIRVFISTCPDRRLIASEDMNVKKQPKGTFNEYIFEYYKTLSLGSTTTTYKVGGSSREVKLYESKRASGFLLAIFDAMLLQLTISELSKILRSKNRTRIFERHESFPDGKRGINTYVRMPGYGYNKEETSLLTIPFPTFNTLGALNITFQNLRTNILHYSKKAKEDKQLTIAGAATAMNSAISRFLQDSGLEKLMNDPTKNLAAESSSPKKVSPSTSQFLISQFMNGVLPTFGIQNAFPTYKVYIIDQNMSDIRFHSLDNWYDFRLVKDLMVIKSKEDPAHLLKCRVIVDERFITTNMMLPQRDSDRRPIEGRNPEPSSATIGVEDSSFYGGKVPLRVGMRICVKLGYHTDPRLLDTVFIGTITGLQGSMEMNVFDLEAHGDGRELSAPSSMTSEAIKGNNFTEIISKMLRASSSVFHLGRNYGTTIEKFTREHHILYGISRACIQGALSTAESADVVSKLFTGKPASAMRGIGFAASPFLALSATAGAPLVSGTLLSTAAAGGTVALARSYSLLREANITSQIERKIYEHLRTSLTSDASNGDLFNFRQFIHGNTFNMSKSSGQIFKHFHDVYKYGHDPVDDNIWAVDIWANFTNINLDQSAFTVKATNQQTIWQVLTGIKRCYPNYALDVRPYGARSTLYLGPTNWMMWRTDDPILSMVSTMNQMSNANVMSKSKVTDNIGVAFDRLVDRDEFFDSGSTDSMPPLVEFQRTHLADSDSNIIFNGIQSTPQRGWNSVVINCNGESFDKLANAELHPGILRTKVEQLDWTTNTDIANQYALGLLKEGVEKMYGGTLALRGNPKIEPYDKVYISDKINRMHGWIEVETVIHKFDTNFGYTTHITPNMICAVNSDAYKTSSQLIRSMISSNKMRNAILSFAGGATTGALISAGLVTTGVFAAAPLTMSMFAIVSLGAFFGNLALSVNDSVKAVGSILDGGRASDVNNMELLEAMHKDSLYLSAYNQGIWYGFLGGYVVKTYRAGFGDTWKATTAFASGSKEVLKNTFNKVWQSPTRLIPIPTGRDGASFLASLKGYQVSIGELTGKPVRVDIQSFNTGDIDDLKAAKKVFDLEAAKANANPSSQLNAEKITKLKTELTAIESRLASKLTDIETKVTAGLKLKTVPSSFVQGVEPNAFANVSKFAKGMFTMSALIALTEAVSVIPDIFETYMVNYISKSNCITISPLINKNNLMMAGLDGWSNTNAFMHLKNMAVHAKRVLDNIGTEALYNMPTLQNDPLLPNELQVGVDKAMESNTLTSTQMKTARSRVGNKNRKDIDEVEFFRTTVDSLVKKHKPNIKNIQARESLTTEIVLGLMHYESRGNSEAEGQGSVKGSSTATTGRGLMQITAGNHVDRFFKYLPQSEHSKYMINGKRSLALVRQGLKEWPYVNIECGISYLVDLINAEAAYGLGNVEGGTLAERALRGYGPAGANWRKDPDAKVENYKNGALKESNTYLSDLKGYISKHDKSSNPELEVNIKQPPLDVTYRDNIYYPTADNVLNATEIQMEHYNRELKNGKTGAKSITSSPGANFEKNLEFNDILFTSSPVLNGTIKITNKNGNQFKGVNKTGTEISFTITGTTLNINNSQIPINRIIKY